ncbi:MAG: phage tail sheath family protein [Gammaproteobacteria bacterium]|nr:phage tail sheath family protein [Gammaproteobacteria bacterium]
MQRFLHQGIGVEERTSRQQAIAGVEHRPTAFIGACQRGPENQPVLISSFADYEKTFGAVTTDTPLGYALRLYYLNGGGDAWVVRVARNAAAACIELPSDDVPLQLRSVCTGSHDYLRAAVDYDGIDRADGDCFNLTVQRLDKPGTETVIAQETFRYVSCANSHPNNLPQTLARSQLVRCDLPCPGSRPHPTLNYRTGAAEYFTGITRPGKDGARITMADILGSSADSSGLFALTEQYDFEQLYLPPISLQTDLSVPLLRAAARICERRRAILVADAPKSWDSVATALEKIEKFSLRGDNIALYYPWIRVAEPVSRTPVTLPPGGAVAGTLSRLMLQQGPGSTPAGQQVLLRGINRFAEKVDQASSYKLSQKGINSLCHSKIGRKVIWDAVTLAPRDGKKDQITSLKVRRLLYFIGKSIESGLLWTAFEYNNEKLWKKIHDQVYAFLFELMKKGLLQGSVPDAAFTVHCDQGSNPSSLRRQNFAGLEIGVAPLLPSRFVRLSFRLAVAGAGEHR